MSPSKTPRPTRALRRLLGPVTIACVGMGCAIGSGILAAPGEVAACIHTPSLILLIWVFFGGLTLVQSLVTAELATRLPQAGGEYQYLKAAYGDFAAFFFGWSFTIFIVGGGGATIAALLGEFAAELIGWTHPQASSLLGAAAIVAVVLVNALGLKTGAVTQNVLTLLKVLAVLGIAIGACVVSGRWTPADPPAAAAAHDLLTATNDLAASAGPAIVTTSSAITAANLDTAATSGPAETGLPLAALVGAFLAAYWPFTGATDPAKLAEEATDVRRTVPRALAVSAVLLTAVYCAYNYGLLCALAPAEMAGEHNVPARIFGHGTAAWMSPIVLAVSILICFGAISSTFLANVRVLFAMARDGLAFGFLARMSRRQSPIPALLIAGAIACVFVLNRSFGEILRIYFMGSAVLFGLTYYSLIVFRRRDKKQGVPFPETAYRLPGGRGWAIALILFEALVAATILAADLQNGTTDSLASLGMLAAMAILFFVWRRFYPARPP